MIHNYGLTISKVISKVIKGHVLYYYKGKGNEEFISYFSICFGRGGLNEWIATWLLKKPWNTNPLSILHLQ